MSEARNTAGRAIDRKSTRLNSSHVAISYAVFCLKKKRQQLVAGGDPPLQRQSGTAGQQLGLLVCQQEHVFLYFFFFNDTATTEIYTLSLHDALPISRAAR